MTARRTTRRTTPRAAALAAAVLATTAGSSLAQQSPPQDTTLARGQATARTLCAACHSEQPPAKLAPPLAHVARHYRQALPDSAQAVARLAAWLAAPNADRSLLPTQARDRWGFMPTLPLPPEQARDVALYVWTLGKP